MDDAGELPARMVCASGVAAFLLGGFGGGWPASTDSIGLPTRADFVGYPSCMLYAGGSREARMNQRAQELQPSDEADCSPNFANPS
jgi:hypothetical protein